MAPTKMHSEDSVSAEKQRNGPGDSSSRMDGFMPWLLAIPFIVNDQRHQSHEPLEVTLRRVISLYFMSAGRPTPHRLGTTLPPDASVEDRRLLAEIRQELHEGNEEARQVERRLESALANLNLIQNTLPNREGVPSRRGSLRSDASPASPSAPRHRDHATMPRPSVASELPSIVCFRDELYEAGREAVETRNHRARLQRFAVDIETTLSSIQQCLGAVSLTCPQAVPPRSQSWMPQNLAMAVSRVYYYSSDYAEEIISAPLKVSGYTVRLAVLCLAADSCVKLLFRAQFCFDSANDDVQWPFRGAVQLVIHHPKNRASNLVYNVQPSQDIETIMPRNVHNAFFYIAGPVSALRLDQRGFWAVKTLHLSVKIVPAPEWAAEA